WGKKIPSCHKCRRGNYLTQEETEELIVTVPNQKRSNEEICMNSHSSEGRMGNEADEHDNLTVEESILQVEKEQETDEKPTVSFEKPRDKEGDMEWLLFKARLDALEADIKEMKADKAQETSRRHLDTKLNLKEEKKFIQIDTHEKLHRHGNIKTTIYEELYTPLSEKREESTDSFTNSSESSLFDR
ncbi:hypothetical protein ACJMK2_041534, partial [Sinanodonta woodiana]